MEQARISARQLLMLAILFEHGSAMVIPLGIDAKQDVWLAILCGMVLGGGLFFIYYRLFTYYPSLPLTAYSQQIVGPFFGKIIALVYILYFLYIAARVLRDFGELLLTFAYPETPLFVLNAVMMLTVMYAAYKGIEVLARTGELFFFSLYFTAFSGIALVVAAGLIDIHRLQPVLEEGWKRVFRIVFTQTLYVPFGETVVFTMLLPYIQKHEKAKMVGWLAILLSGLNLAFIMAINIAVLGADTVARSTFPLLNTIREIRVANFLERLDVLFMIALVVGGFFKISLFFYAGVIGAADLFRMPQHQRLVYPLGISVLLLSIAIASNFSEHIKEGLNIVTLYMHIPLQVGIPLLLLLFAIIRHRSSFLFRKQEKK
ncbi:spore germination protein KB [Anoxybacillus voinovskiensis]|uniref:Spore germination protein KB n=1 Tax=Anoxybacteroides voinovskiense TaxID=230470 RepID=A0A840DLE6_9BACL|nr:GerAB/ArcD/ProY family transporter [Anoxybacillus voinovskiensis]MBB4073884.1 spore germination protein KB [Anoxybacillus voinovskiensis]GGJ66395.1 spore germination protein KB [Anoxybacillus voinovskiensis]